MLLPSRLGRSGGLVDQLHLIRSNISMSGARAAVGLPPDHQLGPAANAASDADTEFTELVYAFHEAQIHVALRAFSNKSLLWHLAQFGMKHFRLQKHCSASVSTEHTVPEPEL